MPKRVGNQLLIQEFNETVKISTAQLLSMFTVPVTLITGITNAIILPTYVTIIKSPGVAYVLNGNSNLSLIWHTSSAIANINASGFLNSTAETFACTIIEPTATVTTVQDPDILGGNVRIKLDTANMVTGSGDLLVGIVYRVYPRNLGQW